jgi:PhnB protein
MPVKPIPDGYHSVTPYLVVPGAAALIDYLVKAFGAKEIERMSGPDDSVRHAEVKIGDSIVMLGDASGPYPPIPSMLYLYVNDVDATYKTALAAGGTSLQQPANQFYGDRTAAVKDPGGNSWYIASHVEDVSHEEMKKRAAAQVRPKQ